MSIQPNVQHMATLRVHKIQAPAGNLTISAMAKAYAVVCANFRLSLRFLQISESKVTSLALA